MEDTSQGEMTFLEHLEELRWHLIRSILAITVFAIVAFIFKRIVFDVILLGPSQPTFWTNRMLCSLGALVNSSKLCINTGEMHLQNVQVSGQFIAHHCRSCAGVPIYIMGVLAFHKACHVCQRKTLCQGVCLLYRIVIYAWGDVWILSHFSVIDQFSV